MDSQSYIPLSCSSTAEKMSIDEPPSTIGNGCAVSSIVVETCLPGNNFNQVCQDVLLFDSQIARRFTTSDAVYKFTCGKRDCDFSCGVPHLSIVIRVRGQADDEIGVRLQTAHDSVKNILPKVPKGRYSYKTWRNSRFHIVRRMLLCSYAYYIHGDFPRILRLVKKPLHVYILGGLTGHVLDFARNFVVKSSYEPSDEESDMLLSKEYS